MRPRLPLTVVSSVVLLLVCAALASAAPGDPRKRLNPVDQAHARSLLLRKTELPAGTWSVEPTSFSQSNPPCIVRDYSLSALTATGEAGFTYTQGTSVIESNAHLFRSASEARRAFAILSSVGLGRCLGTAQAAEVRATAGASATVAKVAGIRFAGLAAPARGFSIVLRLRSGRQTVSFHYVLMSIARGRAVATIGLVRTGAPWPLSVVRRLAATTAARMTR